MNSTMRITIIHACVLTLIVAIGVHEITDAFTVYNATVTIAGSMLSAALTHSK